MKGLHVCFEGWTASYPYPFLKSGTLISLPCPPFSNMFGMMSACAGEEIKPDGLLLGFEFRSRGRSLELERTQRLKTDPKGRLRPNSPSGIARREFHVHPQLELYVSRVDLLAAFERPVVTPCLGRSQDIAWIVSVKEIELEPVPEGAIGATLVPYEAYETAGMVLPPLVDYYINETQGYTRIPGRISRYQALPDFSSAGLKGMFVRATDTMHLYHPDDSAEAQHAVIMHRFDSL